MGWTYVRTSRDQLIRELTATEDTDHGRREVIDHALIDDVLWSVVRRSLAGLCNTPCATR